ncbi:MAG: HAD family phosphatase [Anaerolineaceae bacterium]|nr:HAD family phosphatase [Anaerolineaceae bacterium]
MPHFEKNTTSKYKLAAFDLDGTILDHGKLSTGTRRTLKALHESGVHVVLATGRHQKMILNVVEALPFVRYAITASGAQVVDLHTNDLISFVPLDHQAAVELTRKITTTAKAINIFIKDFVLIRFGDMVKFRKEVSVKSVRREAKEFFQWARFVFAPNIWVANPKNVVFKINAFFKTTDACERFLIDIKSIYAIEAVSTMGYDIEINSKGVHKGFALKQLCEHLQISTEETIIFGDSANDIEIMKCGGYAVAMGNASEDVKDIADRIAPSIKDDGAAQVLQDLFELSVI